MIVSFKGKQLSYKLLNVLEFTSARKRMSVVLEDSEGKKMLLTKGADSIILPRLNQERSRDIEKTKQYIE